MKQRNPGSSAGRHPLDEPKSKENAVQSIQRAADILNCISNGTNSVTGISEKCKLSKSTVHRLLKALSESELVMQDSTNHQYFLGYSIIKLISTPLTTQEYLTSCASEEMNRLSEVTGETVSLGIKMGLKNINIHVVTSKSDLKVDGANLRMRPIYVGVDGLVLLSQLDDIQISNILNNIHAELKPTHEKINVEAMLGKIKLMRQQGYLTGHNEATLGVSCVSAPVRNYALPAVLNLVGPEIRVRPRITTLTRELLASAGLISEKLAKTNTNINSNR
jgi:IclR family KDG regulon transcriptional repressor